MDNSVIASYCWPNLEVCDMWKISSILQRNCQKTGQLTEKTWGWGWIKVEWLRDPFVICFCYLFWTWPCTTFNSIPIILNLLTKRNIALIYLVTISYQNTKDCARSGSSQQRPQLPTPPLFSTSMFAGFPSHAVSSTYYVETLRFLDENDYEYEI